MNRIEIDEKVFRFVYEMAMDDATLQKAYSGSKDELLEVESAEEHVKQYIRAIIEGKRPCFEAIMGQLKDDFAEYKEFSFGNIQKLVNMTAKYYYIKTYADEKIKENFNCCHCPMDRQMITKVVSDYKKKIKDDPKQKDEKVEYFTVGDKATSDWSIVSWSKISFNDTNDITSNKIYRNFQIMVEYLIWGEGINPIEYDYWKWK